MNSYVKLWVTVAHYGYFMSSAIYEFSVDLMTYYRLKLRFVDVIEDS